MKFSIKEFDLRDTELHSYHERYRGEVPTDFVDFVDFQATVPRQIYAQLYRANVYTSLPVLGK